MSVNTVVPPKKISITNRNRLTAYAFLLPNFLGFLIFILIPVVIGLGLSFYKWDSANPAVFIGIKNILRLFRDETFQISLLNTIYYTVVSVPLTIIVSLYLAILLNQKIKGLRIFRTLYFFPYVTSLVAVATVWLMLLQPTMGPVNAFLKTIGIANPPAWTASTLWAMPAIILVSVWRQVGYYMVIYLAGLQSIPEYLYEAATIDGANAWQKFRHVTLPMLAPTTFLITFLLIAGSFKVFDQVLVMTDGGPGRATNVLVYAIYNQGFNFLNFGYASTIAMVLFIIVLICTLTQFKFEDRLVNYESF